MVWTSRGAGLALGAAFIVGLIYLALQASGVILLIFLAILLASGLEPFVGWLRARVPLGRGATILVVYAGFLLLVAILVFLLVPAALKQFDELSRSLPAFLRPAARDDNDDPAGGARFEPDRGRRCGARNLPRAAGARPGRHRRGQPCRCRGRWCPWSRC